MIKMIKTVLFLMLLFSGSLAFSQNIEFKYRIDFERKMSEKLLTEFSKNKNSEMAKREISAYENPKSEFYLLRLNKGIIQLKYEESISNDLEKNYLSVSNFPLGRKTYRKSNDSLIYYVHEINDKTYYSADSLIQGCWKETGKDSIILGYKVNEIIFESKQAKYVAWYTNELPKDIGVYNLSYNKGFILAFEVAYYPTEAFEKNIIKVYPFKSKKRKKKKAIDFPKINKLYTKKEIKQIYANRNRLLNQPMEVEH